MRWNFLLAILLGILGSAFVFTTEAPIEDPAWWYTNDTPPRVTLSGPAGPLSGPVEGYLRVDPADRSQIVSVSLDGQPHPVNGFLVPVDTTALADGEHTVAVTVRDTSRRQNQATTTWSFRSDNTGPHIDVTVDPGDGFRQGRTTVLRIRSDDPTATLTGTIGDRSLNLQPDGQGNAWAVVGVPPDPGYVELGLEVHAIDALGNPGAFQRTYQVAPTRFVEELLELDPSIDPLAEQGIREEEEAQLQPIYAKGSAPKRWSGPFQVPLDGPLTTEFATRRSYNGRPFQGNHAGLDYGAAMGATVVAPANGVVAYIGTVPLRGNILILDHGAGVYSTYAHLQRVEVQTGDAVKAGAVIARVGSTGLSTGPHLHWEVWVNGANVEPLEWTRREYP